MIKVLKKGNLIEINGHANYASFGQDIVCASASSIIYTTINAICKIDNSAIKVEDYSKMIIEILTDDEIVDKLIINMMELLNDLAQNYPKNINVKEC